MQGNDKDEEVSSMKHYGPSLPVENQTRFFNNSIAPYGQNWPGILALNDGWTLS